MEWSVATDQCGCSVELNIQLAFIVNSIFIVIDVFDCWNKKRHTVLKEEDVVLLNFTEERISFCEKLSISHVWNEQKSRRLIHRCLSSHP